jgi:acetyl-CoA/propionyl-CoA carboxylase biotin carboxyl carrier protein
MKRALQEFVVMGVENNVEYLRDLMEDPDFIAGTMHTGLLAQRYGDWRRPAVNGPLYAAAFLLAQRLGSGATSDTSDTSEALGDTSREKYQENTPWKRLGAWRIQ